MREILFRGKRLDNSEWVDGSFCPKNSEGDIPCIIVYNGKMAGYWFEVDRTTVGQYTGLQDKNGKRIFEGDIIHARMENVKIKDHCLSVVFHNGRFCGLHEKDGGKMWMPLADGVKHLPQDKTPYMEWCEMLGNIHDNPELLKGENT